MPYPHGPTCRCTVPAGDNAGLLKYTVSCAHHRQLTIALARLDDRPALELVKPQAPEPIKPQCSGEMTCDCEKCRLERAQRVRAGIRRVRQPWERAA